MSPGLGLTANPAVGHAVMCFGCSVQGPDWAHIPAEEKLMASSRIGSDDAYNSNHLWTPNAADCTVDSDSRADNSRCSWNKLLNRSLFLQLVGSLTSIFLCILPCATHKTCLQSFADVHCCDCAKCAMSIQQHLVAEFLLSVMLPLMA